MKSYAVLRETNNAVMTITVNRPDALNALNDAVRDGLLEAVEAATTDESIRAVIITGAGEKAFVAGADIKQMVSLSPLEAEALSRGVKILNDAIRACPKPVIAAVNGYCLGGGFELALACDIRLASDKARFGLPEVKLGVLPGGGGTVRLARMIGPGAAQALCMTGDMISADRALAFGLVSDVFLGEDFATSVQAQANTLAAMSPVALSQIKSLFGMVGEADIESAQAAESKAFALCFAAEDQIEGMQAFIEKRKPVFKGK